MRRRTLDLSACASSVLATRHPAGGTCRFPHAQCDGNGVNDWTDPSTSPDQVTTAGTMNFHASDRRG